MIPDEYLARNVAEHDDATVVLCAHDGVVEQPAQVLWTTGYRIRPENNDVRKFPILSALYRHSEIAPVWPETQTRAVTSGVANELGDFARQ